MKTYIFPAVRLLLTMTVLTGIIYPVAMTFLAASLFPYQAKGSLVEKNGGIIGSELIGQKFTADKYFHSRPSGIDYNPLPSGGTNWGPTDTRMADSAKDRSVRFRIQNNLAEEIVVPTEMLFSSASGVDPHISPEGARLQMKRIARTRGFSPEQTASFKILVERFIQGPEMELFGNPRVNVLMVNIALDELDRK
ncbi:MAG: potassium-transporting ATPase subunit KdpC [Bacteroidota bacterium]